MDIKHIYRLAAMITEDDYHGLEDADQFESKSYGYGCGDDCWEYEEFPFTINGQHWMGTATIDYDPYIKYYKEVRQTRYDPGEPAYLDVSIGEAVVATFEVFDNAGETIVKWERPNFTIGHLDDNQLETIIAQIIAQFRQDEERVIAYIRENYVRDDEGGSW